MLLSSSDPFRCFVHTCALPCSEAALAPGGVATKATLLDIEMPSVLHSASCPAADAGMMPGLQPGAAACGVCIADGDDGLGSWVAAAQGGLLYVAASAATAAPPVAASAGGEVDQAPLTVQSATAAGPAKLTASFREVVGAAAGSVVGPAGAAAIAGSGSAARGRLLVLPCSGERAGASAASSATASAAAVAGAAAMAGSSSAAGAWLLVLSRSGKGVGSGALADAAAASSVTGSLAGERLLALSCSGAALSAAGSSGTGLAVARAAPSVPLLTPLGGCAGVVAAPPFGVWDVVSKVDAATRSSANGVPEL